MHFFILDFAWRKVFPLLFASSVVTDGSYFLAGFCSQRNKVGIGVQNSAYANDACIGLGDLRITGHWLLLLNQGKESV